MRWHTYTWPSWQRLRDRWPVCRSPARIRSNTQTELTERHSGKVISHQRTRGWGRGGTPPADTLGQNAGRFPGITSGTFTSLFSIRLSLPAHRITRVILLPRFTLTATKVYNATSARYGCVPLRQLRSRVNGRHSVVLDSTILAFKSSRVALSLSHVAADLAIILNFVSLGDINSHYIWFRVYQGVFCPFI